MTTTDSNIALVGSERAALVLMTIGEQEAANVLKYMDRKEVQAIGSAMTTLQHITMEHVHKAMQDFMVASNNQIPLAIGSQEYLKNVLTKALGERKANTILSRILAGADSGGLDALKWMEADTIASVIRNEHPQIIAIVLVHLDPDQAGKVVNYLDEQVRSDVLIRVASLDGVNPSALDELDSIMEKQFSGSHTMKVSNIGGIKTAADILNAVDTDVETGILDHIKSVDNGLCEKIQSKMFVFENLENIDDRGFQTLLREISTDILVIALKGASPEIQEKIFKNMSKRAAEMLKDDLEAKGPVRLSEVEEAQKEVIDVALRLAGEGAIMIGGKGEEFV